MNERQFGGPASQQAFKTELKMILTTLFARLQAWLRYRRNVEVLSRLTDRELADIGLNRGIIEEAARRAATA